MSDQEFCKDMVDWVFVFVLSSGLGLNGNRKETKRHLRGLSILRHTQLHLLLVFPGNLDMEFQGSNSPFPSFHFCGRGFRGEPFGFPEKDQPKDKDSGQPNPRQVHREPNKGRDQTAAGKSGCLPVVFLGLALAQATKIDYMVLTSLLEDLAVAGSFL